MILLTRCAILSGFMASAGILPPSMEMSVMSVSTPVLPPAEDLAGHWRLDWSGGGCLVSLSATLVAMPRPAADAWALTLAPGCALSDALEWIRAWRPASDGITMVDAQGRTRLFLSRTGPGAYEAVLPSGQLLRLMHD
ncbi:protease inhibitor Inh/omp19 family protein [Brevundimonas sp.]|uniref:protease inhibitor Inh/omp19 family protein n=1 Tax=Brevundimonas sp. TaxID=1871086 RepID=UPI00391BC362